MTHVICDHCRATGRDPEKCAPWRWRPIAHQCNACRGTGRGAVDPQNPVLRLPCVECDGIGIRPSARCPVCLGRGGGDPAELAPRLQVALAGIAARCAKYTHSTWDRDHGIACHKSGSARECAACQFAAAAPHPGE